MRKYHFLYYLFVLIVYSHSLASFAIQDNLENEEAHSPLSTEKINIDVERFWDKVPKDRGLSMEQRKQIMLELDELHTKYSRPLIENNNDIIVNSQLVLKTKSQFPVYRFELGNPSSSRKVIITSGSHAGTEPHTVLVALKLIKNYLNHSLDVNDTYIVIYPLLNPWGFLNGKRRTEDHMDLNRVFLLNEIINDDMRLVADSLRDQKYHLALDLHGAISRKHFFVIRNSADQGLAEKALSIFAEQLLLPSNSGTYPDYAYYKKYPKRYLLLAPGISETHTAGTIKNYLSQYATYSYTLEYADKMYPEDISKLYLQLIQSFIGAF